MANAGSEPFGASALSCGIFWNICAVSTNTLRYSDSSAVTA